jgi:hypothetical protein
MVSYYPITWQILHPQRVINYSPSRQHTDSGAQQTHLPRYQQSGICLGINIEYKFESETSLETDQLSLCIKPHKCEWLHV